MLQDSRESRRAGRCPQRHRRVNLDIAPVAQERVVAPQRCDFSGNGSLRELASRERRHVSTKQQTIDICDRMGVGWTVLRPTMIYDEGRDANVTRLATLIEKFGFMPLAGSGAGQSQPVHA